MVKKVKEFKDISLLGKSLNDLADEIVEGRKNAVEGILTIAKAYAEGLRRFSNAEEFFANDPRTRWMSDGTKRMLRMVASSDLDPRVVMIVDASLVGFISKMPFSDQKNLLDNNPYIEVYDCATGTVDKVSYIDIRAGQVKQAYDQENQRFRTVEEQKNYISNCAAKKRHTRKNTTAYKRIGNVVRFAKNVEVGRNELADILRSMGFEVTDKRAVK